MTTVHGLFVFFIFPESPISSNMWILPPASRSETSRDVLTTAGLIAGCGSGANRNAMAAAPTIPRDHERCSNSKTGVRSYHNPYHQGKGESTKHLAAHQEQDEHGKESQSAGQYGSRESLIDRFVHDRGKLFAPQQAVVFANAVENNDGVVHRIADQSEQRGDDR